MDTVISFRAGLRITAADVSKFPEAQGEIISLMLTAATINCTSFGSDKNSTSGKINIGELIEVLVNCPHYPANSCNEYNSADSRADRIIRIREVGYALKTLLRLGIVRHKVSAASKDLFISLESIASDNVGSSIVGNNEVESSPDKVESSSSGHANTLNESCKLSGLCDETF